MPAGHLHRRLIGSASPQYSQLLLDSSPYYHWPLDDSWGATAGVADDVEEVVKSPDGLEDMWRYSGGSNSTPSSQTSIMDAGSVTPYDSSEAKRFTCVNASGNNAHFIRLGQLPSLSASGGKDATIAAWFKVNTFSTLGNDPTLGYWRSLFGFSDEGAGGARNVALLYNASVFQPWRNANWSDGAFLSSGGVAASASQARDTGLHFVAAREYEDGGGGQAIQWIWNGVYLTNDDMAADVGITKGGHILCGSHTSNLYDTGSTIVDFQSVTYWDRGVSNAELLALYNAGVP